MLKQGKFAVAIALSLAAPIGLSFTPSLALAADGYTDSGAATQALANTSNVALVDGEGISHVQPSDDQLSNNQLLQLVPSDDGSLYDAVVVDGTGTALETAGVEDVTDVDDAMEPSEKEGVSDSGDGDQGTDADADERAQQAGDASENGTAGSELIDDSSHDSASETLDTESKVPDAESNCIHSEVSSHTENADQLPQAAAIQHLPKRAPLRAQGANSGTFLSESASGIYWSFSSGTLTLTVTDTSKCTLTESDADAALPWKGSITPDRISYVVMDSRIKVASFYNWFANCQNLISFTINEESGVKFDASGITSYKSMFQGCKNLGSMSGTTPGKVDTRGWATKWNADYTNMFKDCSKLEALDLTGWTVSAATNTDMLSGLSAIKTLIVPGTVVLGGTGFGDTASRGETAGTWSKGTDEIGSAATIVTKHDSEVADGELATYTFALDSYFASNSDKNVRWSFNETSGTLTLYVVDASKDATVSETADKLPWIVSVDTSKINTIVARTFDGNATTESGTAVKIAPATLEAWFTKYANLQFFDGRGFDVSKIGVSDGSFANLFAGDAWLSSLNLSGWKVKCDTNKLTYMFSGCTSLANLTISADAVLAGTSLSNNLSGRAAADGVWKIKDGTWFGTTDNLVSRYPVAANRGAGINGIANTPYPTIDITYLWTANEIGGRFQNDDAWWKFKNGELTLGVDGDYRTVNESADEQPWKKDAAGTAIVDISKIVSVAVDIPNADDGSDALGSGIAPVILVDWFKGYTNLKSFDGRGMDVSGTTDFSGIFGDLKYLTSINLEGWSMGEKSTRGGMFSGTTGLRQITLSDGVVLDGSGFDDGTAFGHTTNVGSWQTDDKVWFGSSANLASRYPALATAAGNAVGTYIYVWSTGLKSGRFPSNDNAWWKYDESSGTLTIGVTLPKGVENTGAARAVSEVSAKSSTYDGDKTHLLPWLNVLTNAYKSVVKVVFQGTDGSEGTDDLRLIARDPEAWFEGYELLGSFEGAGLDVGHATANQSLAGFFQDCIKLASINGLVNWNVSQITSLGHLFDNCKLLLVVPDVDDWKTGNVTDFSYIFRGNEALTVLTNLKKWNVSKATTFESAFDGAKFVTDFDISGWQMPKDATITRMLADTGYVKLLKVSNGTILAGTGFFDDDIFNSNRDAKNGSWWREDGGEADPWFGTTANVVARYPQTGAHVRNASGTVDQTSIQTYSWRPDVLCGRFPSNDNAWWKYDTALKVLTIGTDFQKGEYGTTLAVGETAYKEYLAEAGLTQPTGMGEQPWLPVIEGGNARTNVKTITFAEGAKLTVTNIYRWFYHYEALNTLDLAGLVLPPAADALKGGEMLESFLEGCYNLTKIDNLAKLGTSELTSFKRLFAEDHSLTSVSGTGDWDTSKVTNLSQMFLNNPELLVLADMGKWDVRKVSDFSEMFSGDAKLAQLDLSGWDMTGSILGEGAGSAPSRTDMFKGCVNLGDPVASGVSTASLTLGLNVILESTGFGELSTRERVDGSWDADDKVWFGGTPDLLARYPELTAAEKVAGTVNNVEGAAYPSGVITYTWAAGKLRGRFKNDNAWWTFDWTNSGKTVGTLTIGADAGINELITETDDPANRTMPWLAVIGGEAKVAAVTSDADHAFQATDPTGWFAGYTKLASFNGPGFDVLNLTSLAGMFKNCVSLKTFQGVSGWDVSNVQSMAELFSGDTSLTTVKDTDSWKTIALTDLYRTFYQNTSLTQLTTVASWDTSKVTDFRGLFQNDYQLATLYLDNWDMRASVAPADADPSVAYGRDNMFGGARGLSTIKLGANAILEGTGFDNSLTYNTTYGPRLRARDGSWSASLGGWFGSTTEVAERYPASKAGTVNGVDGAVLPAVTLTYTWTAALRGRFTNHNAWWRYDSGPRTLTLGTDNANGNTTVTETAVQLPWSSGVAGAENQIPTLYNSSYASIGTIVAQGGLSPETLEGWFSGYGSLVTFDGKGMNVSKVGSGATVKDGSFKNIFLNDASLKSVDLSTWQMGESISRTGMFVDCTKLGDSTGTGFVLGKGVVLTDTGIDGLSTRKNTQGRWLVSQDGTEIWFDSSVELQKRYGTSEVLAARYGAGAARPADTYIYVWDTSTLGGRFYSNQHAWWTFKPSSGSVSSISTIGTLTIGADTSDDAVVEEHATVTDANLQLPWLAALGNKPERVTKVAGGGSGRVAPESLEGWFKNMTKLTSFSGAGITASHATSLADLFRNDYLLSTLTNIDWDTSQVEDFSYAFYNDTSLDAIELYAWDVTKGKNFSYIFALDDTHRDAAEGKTVGLTKIVLSNVSKSWNMLPNENRRAADIVITGMFDNLRYLKTLTLADEVVLSEFSGGTTEGEMSRNAGISTKMYYHTASDGSWATVSDRAQLEDNNDLIIGNSDNLASRYTIDPADTRSFFTTTYTWHKGFIKGAFNSNPNVWWIYDRDETTGEGTIKVGVTGTPTSTKVTEFNGTYEGVSSQLPWVSTGLVTDPNNDSSASGATPVHHFVSTAEAGVIQPENLLNWFKGYKLLEDFNGAGLDLSLTKSMEGLFEGDVALTSVTDLGTAGVTTSALTSLKRTFYGTSLTTLTDISGWDTSNVTSYEELFALDGRSGDVKLTGLDLSHWDMSKLRGDSTKVKDMLAGMEYLNKLKLNDSIILANTGFTCQLAGRSQYDGMWVTENEHGDRVWFDTTDELAKLYDPTNVNRTGSATATQGLTGTLEYDWDDTHLGGRFASNANAWWMYTKTTSGMDLAGTLALGADGGTSGAKRIYESYADGETDANDTAWGKLPWQSVILTGGKTGTFNTAAIKYVTTTGHLAPINLESWFLSHTELLSFDGAGLDTTYVKSMAHLFEGASKLGSKLGTTQYAVSGTKDWKTPALTSVASMFKNAKSVASLESFAGWAMAKVTDFSSMFEGATSLQYATGIANWVTTGATTFKAMFKNASSLKSVSFSGWDMRANTRTSGVLASDYADQMMFGCTSLTTVELGKYFGQGTADKGTDTGNPQGTAPKTAAPTRTLVVQSPHNYSASKNYYLYAPESTYLTITFNNSSYMGTNTYGWWSSYTHYDHLRIYNGIANGAAGTQLADYVTSGMRGMSITSNDQTLRIYVDTTADGRNGNSNNYGFYAVVTSDGPIYLLLDSSTDAGTGQVGASSSGYWKRESDGWLGSWGELMDTYDERGGTSMAGIYTWTSGAFGGRFNSNLNAWWTYVAGTLSLYGNGTAAESKVTETANTSLIDTADQVAGTEVVPFEFLRSWPIPSNTYTYVKDIKTYGQLAPVNMESWFNTYHLLQTFDGSGLDTSYATRFKNLFANNQKVTSGSTVTRAGLTSVTGLIDWDTSKVETFERVFYSDTALTTLTSLAKWETGAAKSFARMFQNVVGLTSLDDLQSWHIATDRAVDLQHMFDNTRITALDRIASWTTDAVTNYSYMFANNPDLVYGRAIGAAGTKWVLASDADLTGLFEHDTALAEVDFSRWDMRGRTVANMLNVNPASASDKTAVALKTIYLANDDAHVSVLAGSGLSNTLNGRAIPDGVWRRGDDGWYDCTDKLVLLYPASGTVRFAGVFAYVWQDVPGGRLTKDRTVNADGTTTDIDNDYVYWQFIADATSGSTITGTLNIAVTDYTGAKPDLTVINTGDELPWQSLIDAGVRITKVHFNGGVKLVNPQRWFKGYVYLTDFDGSGIDFSGVGNLYQPKDKTGKTQGDTSLEAFLMNCTNLATVTGVDTWLTDVAHVTSLKNLFAGDSSLASIDGIQRWQVDAITDMEGLFQSAHSLSDLNFLLNWHVGNVTTFDNMFNDATALTDLDKIKKWDTHSATSMKGMFASLPGSPSTLSNVDLTGWDVSHVLSFDDMFRGDSNIKTLNISTWDMTASTSRTRMFAGLTGLNTLVLGPKVILTDAGFFGSTATDSVSLNGKTYSVPRGLSTRRAIDGYWQLNGGLWYDYSDRLAERYAAGVQPTTVMTYEWKGGTLGGHFSSNQNAWWQYDIDSRTLTFGLDSGTTDADKMQVSETRTPSMVGGNVQQGSTLLDGDQTFQLPWLVAGVATNEGTYRAEHVVARNGIVVLNPASWFENYYYLASFTGAAMDVSQAKSLSRMFYNARSLGTLTGLVGWDLSTAVDLSYLFYDDNALTSLDAIRSWKTPQVTTMSHMFDHASALADATGISDWDVSAATDLSELFLNCAALTRADFRGWDMTTAGEGATRTSLNLASLFQGTALTEITLGTKSYLAGSYLLELRPDANGRWRLPSDTWFGNTTALIGRYSAAGNTLASPLTYTWDGSTIGGRFDSNPENTWWTYNIKTHVLTIGTDKGADTLIKETGDALPWAVGTSAAGVGKANVYSVKFDGAPVVESPSHWFDGYANLKSFDGTNLTFTATTTDASWLFANNPLLATISGVAAWDMGSMTTMAGMFANDYALKDNKAFAAWDTGKVADFSQMFAMGAAKEPALALLDFTGWDMTKATTVENMLAGCKNLSTIIADKQTVLAGSGLDDTLATRTSSDGRWVLGQKVDGLWQYSRDDKGNTWWGSSKNLSEAYTLGGNAIGDDELYTWDDTTLGGRFTSDVRAWWTYAKATKTLDLGTQDDERIEVEETYDKLPWVGAVPLQDVVAITSHGQVVLPADSSQWFASTPFARTEQLDGDHTDLTKWTIRYGTRYYTVNSPEQITVTNRQNWSYLASKGIALKAGTPYTLSAWMKNDAYSGRLRLDLVYDYETAYRYYAAPYEAAYLAFDTSGTSDWSFHTVSFTVPADRTYYLVLGVWEINPSSTPQKFALREVSLVANPGYGSLTSFDGTGLDVSRVQGASQMFAGDHALSSFTGVIGWKTASLTNAHAMFEDDYQLANISLMRNWDMSHVTDMGSMFADARSLESNEAITGWNTSAVKDFSRMFYGDRKLATLDLSSWDMQGSTDRTDMIGVDAGDRNSLTTLIASEKTVLTDSGMDDDLTERTPGDGTWVLADGSWFDCSSRLAWRYPSPATHTGKLTYRWDDTFLGGGFEPDDNAWWKYVKKDEQLILGSRVAKSVVQGDSYAPENLPWVKALGYAAADGDSDATAASFKAAKDRITNVTSEGGIIVRNPVRWFEDYDELMTFDGSGMDVLSSTSLAGLFAGDEKLSTLTGLTWNTSTVEDMSRIFAGDVALGDDDLVTLKDWSTKGAKTMASMFEGCAGITELSSLSLWETENVKDFSSMFKGCTGLKDQTAIKNWKVAGADLSHMFEGCTALETVDFSKWDLQSCTSVLDMLAGDCALLQITAGPTTVLEGTGLTDTLAQRTPDDGSWTRDITQGGQKWADSTGKLAALYPQGGTKPDAVFTYNWEQILRGRFDNKNVWWEYNVGTKTLTIGYDGPEGGNNSVTEIAKNLPWRALAPPSGHEGEEGYTHVMEHVVFQNGVRVENPAGWFKDHDALVDVQAEHLDLTRRTSRSSMASSRAITA